MRSKLCEGFSDAECAKKCAKITMLNLSAISLLKEKAQIYRTSRYSLGADERNRTSMPCGTGS